MRKHLILIIGILALAGQAFAQRVDVSLTLAYGTFITGEPVLIQVKMTNMLRGALDFGEDSDDRFLIEVSKNDRYHELTPDTDQPFIKPVTVAVGNTFEYMMEVDKWFTIDSTGKYLIRAVVVHDDMRYESVVRSFDIVPGIPIKDGVQMFAGKQRFQRNFKLVRWTRNQFDRLFLRIEDEPSGKVWDTIDLGMFVKGVEPKLDIAPNGEVTVFHRANADSFLQTILWSLSENVEISERNSLLDPAAVSAQQMRSVYGDMTEKTEEKKASWWKFWQ